MVQKIIISVSLLFVWATASFAEEMKVKKIVLGRFKVKNDIIIDLSKTTPYWPQVNRHILTVDDTDRVYLLNLWNNEILVFNATGKLINKISLPVKLNRFDYMNGQLEVAGDGERFFVYGYDASKKAHQLTLDQHGNIIKQFAEDEIVWSFPDTRLCDKTFAYLRGPSGPALLDANFKLIGGRIPKISDAEGHYDVDFKNKRKTLIKYSKDSKKLWEKQFDGYFEIIGVDVRNNLYLRGVLKKGNPDSLYKLNSKGAILAQATVPNPVPLLTREEKDESEAPSEEFLLFFKLACNGNIYLIFQLSELPKRTYQRWLTGSEYFIYKFETNMK